jgi:hypothetical protein
VCGGCVGVKVVCVCYVWRGVCVAVPVYQCTFMYVYTYFSITLTHPPALPLTLPFSLPASSSFLPPCLLLLSPSLPPPPFSLPASSPLLPFPPLGVVLTKIETDQLLGAAVLIHMKQTDQGNVEISIERHFQGLSRAFFDEYRLIFVIATA